jgi:hypothetical protein
VLCVVVRIRNIQEFNSSISRRGVPYLDLNWRDIRIDELVLRYPLYHTSNLVVAEPIFRPRTYENLRRENSQEKAVLVFKNALLVRVFTTLFLSTFIPYLQQPYYTCATCPSLPLISFNISKASQHCGASVSINYIIPTPLFRVKALVRRQAAKTHESLPPLSLSCQQSILS